MHGNELIDYPRHVFILLTEGRVAFIAGGTIRQSALKAYLPAVIAPCFEDPKSEGSPIELCKEVVNFGL